MECKIFQLLKSFFENLKNETNIDEVVYNEFSLQHELGIFLRNQLNDNHLKVQFERNVSFFFDDKKDFDKKEFIKKEIDIVIFDQEKKEKYAIEVKFPKNGQFPEQMYSFIKDIRFMEQLQLTEPMRFTKTFAVCLVENPNFYQGNVSEEKIYKYFRNEPQIIQGNIQKPTGEIKSDPISLKKQYQIQWQELKDDYRYYIVEIL